MTWQQEEIENTVLTEEELREAILEGKRKKWHHERTKEYWEEQEFKREQLKKAKAI
jgi:hypothetical protein